MPKRSTRTARGVTVIELLVTLSITSVILVATSGILIGIRKQWVYSVTRGKAVQAAQVALDQIANDVSGSILFQAADGTKTNTFTRPANTDSQGNYVPARVSGVLQYVSGGRVRYYLSDAAGTAGSGTMLWRETNNSPTGDAGWTKDSAWSLAAGTGTKTKYNNVSSIAFSTAGLPGNVVQISITVLVAEGAASSSLSLQRNVYLANHN